MKPATLAAIILMTGLGITPLGAQDAGQASGDDVFNNAETTTQTTDQTQNAAPRNTLLTETTPRITGTFTSQAGFTWNWSNIYGSPFTLVSPTSSNLDEEGSGAIIGFVARPDTDISVTAEARTYYPFLQQITTGTGPNAETYTVPDVTLWSLYAKFTWGDSLFFTFGQQPVKWGTGYFFSPADDVFAQTAVDITNPTADREGPLALKIQYPIPGTMHNLYFYAALPNATTTTQAASLSPQDIAVAGKAEFLLGNTELAAAGYYQRNQRPEAILMGTTGANNFNFFAEGVAAFPSPVADPFVELAPSPVTWGTGPFAGTSAYTVVDRSADMLYSGTGGVMYSNADWNFTFVAQYLYNGAGYSSLTISDILTAFENRAVGQPAGELALNPATLENDFAGLGRIGQQYGVVLLSWTSIGSSKFDASILALANLSDGSGFINPTVTFTTSPYVKLSGGFSLSWGGTGTEYADPTGFASTFPTINGQPNPSYNPHYVAEPTLAVTLSASFGTVSF